MANATKNIHMTLREGIMIAILIGLLAGHNPPSAQAAVATALAITKETLRVSEEEMDALDEVRDTTP